MVQTIMSQTPAALVFSDILEASLEHQYRTRFILIYDLLELSLMLVDFPVEWHSVGYGYLLNFSPASVMMVLINDWVFLDVKLLGKIH
jgi:hypothetical protein